MENPGGIPKPAIRSLVWKPGTGDIKIYTYGKLNYKPGVSKQDNKMVLGFPATISVVEFRYAISFISTEQAKINFEKEVGNKNFASVEQNAKKVWSSLMSRIQVEGGSESQRRSFYTALYRCHERMVDISEDSFYYSGYDKKIERG